MTGNYHFSIRRLTGTLRRPGFWFIMAILALLTFPHYAEALQHPAWLNQITSDLGLDRHAFERILYLAPIVWAGFIFNWKGAFITSLAALGCMLPRAIIFSTHQIDAYFETAAVFVIGNVLTISFASLRREREYRTQLEDAQDELKANVRVIQEDKVRLSALNRVAATVSQSLELNEILDNAIDSIVDCIQADVVLIFLLDKNSGKLSPVVYRGVTEDFAKGVDRLGVGEGFNGRVAESAMPMFVEDVSQDPRLTREVLNTYNVRSLLSVPMSCKGKVNGTICVAMKRLRSFQAEETDLLIAIGNQIGVAIENARLYQEQQAATEELGMTQQNLRYYLQQATQAQEEERKRISHELHDDTIQALVVLSRQLDALATSNGVLAADTRQQLEELWHQTDSILKGVRRLSQDLRPAALDRLGLLPALEWLAANVTEFSGIAAKVNVTGREHRLPEEVAIALFRIAQEAMRNVWRHSEATNAVIDVEFLEDRTRITVSDNGCGFDLPPNIADLAKDGKLGLTGMHERAQLVGGTLSAESQPGKGTRIIVELPG